MDRKKLIKRLTFLIFFILGVNFLANKFYWYSLIWYFDIPMHFLGGFWVGLAFTYLFPFKGDSKGFIFKILLPVLGVGIAWEVFEIAVNEAITRDALNYLDTASDILFDLSGGALAILYYLKKIMPNGENTIQ